MASLYLIGIGPGSMDNLTGLAVKKLNESSVIIGYKYYINLIRPILKNKEIIESEITNEVDRAERAVLEVLNGKTVSLVSSGDSGIYGMAGLALEIISKKNIDIDVHVIPGISALNSAAALLGSPIMNDFCSISLSTNLTPWNIIEKRIMNAAEADFVIIFYNPKSMRRQNGIVNAMEIIKRYRNESTPVGIVKNAYRDGQEVILTDIKSMDYNTIDMFSTVIIGNSQTYLYKDFMITPRGYSKKYEY
ncbi:hypothetical protein SE19_09075 [Acidiplasma aeolicum]|uniref:Tetrapyrrole methylase domain-containing protein n=2 Tax=Acidiplasma TaxID=507753 RepID=A0A0Q0S0K6_9ARCH|nr:MULTISPECIES: precorrin-3B C(17)-methyltransferase [Acidiplasma]KPV43138.1 hypothetical protein SE19_09075 [Acidiplasma aeolicum]KQB36478.1 hypothetical protein AOG55_03895 [Acidiplasma cupricumulans]